MTSKAETYLVPAGYGAAELLEKRSRFISRIWPVDDETQAMNRIEEIRRQHRDANHNVYAYSLYQNNLTRYSDDGEPQGTAGMPTLSVLQRVGVFNICCVITRYFGGTLLGTGSLVRAYGKAAKLALDVAGVCTMRQWQALEIRLPYASFERVRMQTELAGGRITRHDFGADVTLEVMAPVDNVPLLVSQLAELGGGHITTVFGETRFGAA